MTHPWRDNPRLKGRFHADAPDDLQVLVHDGGPRLTARKPELIWVTVTSEYSENVFAGRVINQPHQLKSVQKGSAIRFVAPAGEHLLMVTEEYLAERPAWKISPCNQCGLDELFDTPSDLQRAVFPDLPADSEVPMFTAFCGVCGGVQVVQNLSLCDSSFSNSSADMSDISGETRDSKKWWQFWK